MSEYPNTLMETEMEIKDEELCPVTTERMQSTQTEDINSAILPGNYEVDKAEDISDLSELISQLTNHAYLSLRCRLCALPSDDMVGIFSSNETEGNISEKIKHSLCIVVRESDRLPKQACRSCLANLELCYQFHKTVLEAERQLVALDRLASAKFGQRDRNCETLPLYDEQRGATVYDNTDGSLDTTSDVETIDIKTTIITEADQTTDTTVKTKNLLSSLRPCSVVLSNIKAHCKKTTDTDNGRTSSSNTECINPDLTTEVVDSGKTIASEIKEESTGDTEMHRIDLAHDEQPQTRVRRWKCTSCTKMFTAKKNLVVHNKLHTGEGLYSCKYCKKKFAIRSHRDRHHYVHSNERPYKCFVCEKMFKDPYVLKRHEVGHGEDTSYYCSLCNKSFRSSRNTHNTKYHTGEGRYSCEYCEKKFACKSVRDRHTRRIHMGERPFKCPICGRSFILWSRMKHHETTVHSEERNHPCPLCNKSFKTRSVRQRHMAIHTNNRPQWQCIYCENHYIQKGYLQHHSKICKKRQQKMNQQK